MAAVVAAGDNRTLPATAAAVAAAVAARTGDANALARLLGLHDATAGGELASEGGIDNVAGSAVVPVGSVAIDEVVDSGDGSRLPLLCLAAQYGQLDVVRLLHANGADLRCQGRVFPTAVGVQPVHLAAASGSIKVLQYLVTHGIAVDAVTTCGSTPLFFAAESGQLDAARCLLQLGARPGAVNSRGSTPLMLAALAGAVPVCRLLIAHGADVHAVTHDGGSALVAAVQRGNAEAAQLLITHSVDVNAPVGSSAGVTPLLLACQFGYTACVDVLLNAGADASVAASNGMTALHIAASAGFADVCTRLLRHATAGADVDRRCLAGSTPTFLAARGGHDAALAVLLDAGADAGVARDGWTPLAVACRRSHRQCALLFLTRATTALRVDAVSPTGETALSIACQRNWVEVVRQLLACGADPNVHTPHHIPLCLAARHAYTPEGVVDLLLAAGADPTSAANDGTTSVFVAAQDGRHDTLRRLTSAGAGVDDIRSHDGVNAVFMAAYGGHVRCLELLVEHGANVNVRRPRDMSSAVFGACKKGHVGAVRVLLRAGVDVEVAMRSGMTPLCVAAWAGFADIVKLLLSAGADLEAHTTSGTTPVSAAAARGNVAALQVLLDQGADFLYPNRKGETPLSVANNAGRAAAAATLLHEAHWQRTRWHARRALLTCRALRHTGRARALVEPMPAGRTGRAWYAHPWRRAWAILQRTTNGRRVGPRLLVTFVRKPAAKRRRPPENEAAPPPPSSSTSTAVSPRSQQPLPQPLQFQQWDDEWDQCADVRMHVVQQPPSPRPRHHAHTQPSFFNAMLPVSPALPSVLNAPPPPALHSTWTAGAGAGAGPAAGAGAAADAGPGAGAGGMVDTATMFVETLRPPRKKPRR